MTMPFNRVRRKRSVSTRQQDERTYRQLEKGYTQKGYARENVGREVASDLSVIQLLRKKRSPLKLSQIKGDEN